MGSQYRVPYYLTEHRRGAISKTEATKRLQRQASREAVGAQGETLFVSAATAPPGTAGASPLKPSPGKKSQEGWKSPVRGGASALFSSHRASKEESSSSGMGSAKTSPLRPAASPSAPSEKKKETSSPKKETSSPKTDAGAPASPPKNSPPKMKQDVESATQEAASDVYDASATSLEVSDAREADLRSQKALPTYVAPSDDETSESDEDTSSEEGESSVASEEEENSPYASEATLRKALHAHCMKRKDLPPKVELCLKGMLDAHRNRSMKWHYLLSRVRRYGASLNRPKKDLCDYDSCEFSSFKEQTAIRQETGEDGSLRLGVEDLSVCTDVSKANILEEDSCSGMINLSLELMEFSIGNFLFTTKHLVALFHQILSSPPSFLLMKLLNTSTRAISKLYHSIFRAKGGTLPNLTEGGLKEMRLEILKGNYHNCQLAAKYISLGDKVKNRVDATLLEKIKKHTPPVSLYLTGALQIFLSSTNVYLVKILPSLVNVYGSGIEVALTFVSLLLPKWEIDNCMIGRYRVRGWYVFAPSLALSIFMGYYAFSCVSSLAGLTAAAWAKRARGLRALVSTEVQDKLTLFNAETNKLLVNLVKNTKSMFSRHNNNMEVTPLWIQNNITNYAIAMFFNVLENNFGRLYVTVLEIFKSGSDVFNHYLPEDLNLSSAASSTYLEKLLAPFQDNSQLENKFIKKVETMASTTISTVKEYSAAAFDRVFGQTNLTQSLREVESSAKASEAVTGFTFGWFQTFAKTHRALIEAKQVSGDEEWIKSYLRSFLVSFYYFLFSNIFDFLLCKIAQIFWKVREYTFQKT